MWTTTTEPVIEPRMVIEFPAGAKPSSSQVAEIRHQLEAYPQLIVLPDGARLRTIGPDGSVSVDYAVAAPGIPGWMFALSLALASGLAFLLGLLQ